MKTLIGGAVAAVFGLIGLSVWFSELLQLLAGSIPIMLLFGGGLALYLGFDELKDTWKTEDLDNNCDKEESIIDDTDKYKNEIEKLKSEIDKLKAKKD